MMMQPIRHQQQPDTGGGGHTINDDDLSTLQCLQGDVVNVNLPYPSSQEDSSSTFLLRHQGSNDDENDDTDFLVITASSLTTIGSLKISKNTLLPDSDAKKVVAEEEDPHHSHDDDEDDGGDDDDNTNDDDGDSRCSSAEPENPRDSPLLQQRSGGLTATEATDILRSRARQYQAIRSSSYLSSSSRQLTTKRISFEEDCALEVVTQIAVSEVDTPPSRRKSFAAASTLFEEAMACATAYTDRNPSTPTTVVNDQLNKVDATTTTGVVPAAAKLPVYSIRRDSIEIKMDKSTIAGRGLLSVLAAPLVPRRASSGGRAASIDSSSETPPKDTNPSALLDTATVISPPNSFSSSSPPQDQQKDNSSPPVDNVVSTSTVPSNTTTTTKPLANKLRIVQRNSALEFARLSSSTNPVLLLRPKPAPTATYNITDMKMATGASAATSVTAFRQFNSSTAIRRPPTPAILVPRSRAPSIEASSSQRERSTSSIGGSASSPPLGTESQPRTPSNSQQQLHCTTPQQQGEVSRPTATPSLSPIVPLPRGSPPLGGTSGTFRLSSLFRDTVTTTPPKTAGGLQFAATTNNKNNNIPPPTSTTTASAPQPRFSDAPVVIAARKPAESNNNNTRGGTTSSSSTFLPLNDISIMSVTGGDSMM